jgi:two-component system chemotaxis response regulator CheY
MSKTILVVDDSATVRQQVKAFLQTNDFIVVEGGNGVEGLSQAKSQQADLVMVDVNMPVMSGIEMIGELRKLPGYDKTPIFVMTSESTPAMAAKGKEAGATAWIVKPFKPELVLKGIQKVLGMK